MKQVQVGLQIDVQVGLKLMCKLVFYSIGRANIYIWLWNYDYKNGWFGFEQ